MKEVGVTEILGPNGDTRYQVVAKIKGQYALLGWYPTHKQAMKAYKRATES